MPCNITNIDLMYAGVDGHRSCHPLAHAKPCLGRLKVLANQGQRQLHVIHSKAAPLLEI